MGQGSAETVIIGAAIGGGMAATILGSVLWRMRVSRSRKAIDAADGVVLVRMSDLRNLLAAVE